MYEQYQSQFDGLSSKYENAIKEKNVDEA